MMQTETVIFRASPQFVNQLARKAEQEGLSKSELLRSAVNQRDGQPVTDAPPIDICVSPERPMSIHERAASGDVEAFAMLAGLHYQRGQDGIEPALIAFAKAAEYARLAVTAGGDRQTWVTFLYILQRHSEVLRKAGLEQMADRAQGEAVALR
ncbi:MAG: hypothetical protein ABIT09_07740 [Croceibacterium sp.]